MQKLSADEHRFVSKYIYEISGITIEYDKSYLIESRLGNLVKENGLSSYIDLCHRSKAEPSKTIETKIIDAITTNETLFFRDTLPFELIKHKIIPELIDKKATKSNSQPISINIWSAACSTGQEIFSIAIILKKLFFDSKKYHINLLGTDISEAAINRAIKGVYNKFEIERGLNYNDLMAFFNPEGSNWKINDDIRSMAVFRKQNLMGPFNIHGKFDIIFCRNVAIYFKIEDRINLFKKIANVLKPDGYLIIGATESLTGICPLFEPKRHLGGVFYKLKTHL